MLYLKNILYFYFFNKKPNIFQFFIKKKSKELCLIAFKTVK